MKTIHDQRVYIGSMASNVMLDLLDVYAQTERGEDANICGGGTLSSLKAGSETLAIVFNNAWAEELIELLEAFHKREQGYLNEIARLTDEVGAMRILHNAEAKQQRDINDAMWNRVNRDPS